MIDIRSDANTWEPKPIIPMIETASLVRNEVMIPKDSSLETFAEHVNNLIRLQENMVGFMVERFGRDAVKAFKKALLLASRVMEARNTIPVLGCFLFEIVNEALYVTATSLDIEITATVPASGVDPGKVCVSKSILKLMLATSGDLVTIADEGGRLTVDMADGRASFVTIPGGDFPPSLDNSDGLIETAINVEVMADAFRRLTPFMSAEETRYYLNGICVDTLTKGKTKFAATNGHILCEITAPAPDLQPMTRSIIPSRVVSIASKHKITRASIVDSKTVKLMGGADFKLNARLIDGTFPDYLRVIPSDYALGPIKLRASHWTRKLRRLMTLGKCAMFRVAPDRSSVSINDPDFGSAVFAIEAETDSVRSFSASAKYMISAAVGAC